MALVCNSRANLAWGDVVPWQCCLETRDSAARALHGILKPDDAIA
jgi:hypothetical protein